MNRLPREDSFWIDWTTVLTRIIPTSWTAMGNGVGDVCDNCPTAPNPDQLDRYRDGLGDGCDPTPIHDLALAGLSAVNVTIRKDRVGSGTITATVSVQNLENWPEPFSLQIRLGDLPAGCQITKRVGNNVSGTVRRLSSTSFSAQFTITCAASTPVGNYPIRLRAKVTYTGTGVEQNLSNNSASSKAILRI